MVYNLLQLLFLFTLSYCLNPNDRSNDKNIKANMFFYSRAADISVNISDIVLDLKSKTKTVSFNLNITNWPSCQNAYNSSVLVGTSNYFSDEDIMMRRVELKGCEHKIVRPFEVATENPNVLYMVVAIMKSGNIFSKNVIKILDNPEEKPAKVWMLYVILFPTLAAVAILVIGLWWYCSYYHRKKNENPNQINLLI